MKIEDFSHTVTGEIFLQVFKNNEVVEEFHGHNLVVDVGRKRLAQLAAGKVASYTDSYISHIGLGSGNTEETVGDTELVDQQLFPLTSIEVNGRDVQCNFFITSEDANGLNIHELGLFCTDGSSVTLHPESAF